MTNLYIIIVNLVLGTGMTLVGFKIHKPDFNSKEREELFYKRYTPLFKIGGIAMLAWGCFNLLAAL